jgi:hypothetical protein
MACYICSEYELGKLTEQEAFRALGEILQTETDEEVRNHLFGLSEKILDNQVDFQDLDEDTDYLLDLDEDSDCH